MAENCSKLAQAGLVTVVLEAYEHVLLDPDPDRELGSTLVSDQLLVAVVDLLVCVSPYARPAQLDSLFRLLHAQPILPKDGFAQRQADQDWRRWRAALSLLREIMQAPEERGTACAFISMHTPVVPTVATDTQLASLEALFPGQYAKGKGEGKGEGKSKSKAKQVPATPNEEGGYLHLHGTESWLPPAGCANLCAIVCDGHWVPCGRWCHLDLVGGVGLWQLLMILMV